LALFANFKVKAENGSGSKNVFQKHVRKLNFASISRSGSSVLLQGPLKKGKIGGNVEYLKATHTPIFCYFTVPLINIR
jgi:hypothetical protein